MTIPAQQIAVQTIPQAAERWTGPVPGIVEAHAAARPNARALLSGAEAMTYRELDGRANRIARHLKSLGVGRDVLVGICLPRSPEIAAAALGVWKAGGAYVPMDPSYPPERLAFMLDDAQARVVITTPALASQLPATAAEILDIDGPQIAEQRADPVRSEAAPEDLAYVIYTSGSTGAPKGVEITHSALANLVSWHLEAFSVTSADRASHLAGLGFDASVWELWPYLAAGASVCLADEHVRNSAELLRDWMGAQGITIGFVPTPLAEQMLALEWPADTALRIMLTGGDALHRPAPRELPFTLINNYGPTECTVVATSGRVTAQEEVPPIGRPIANTQIYLLDDRLEQVPPGVPGEMFIGGASVARGYHNRPGLTAERFIRNPFDEDPRSRLYRTGDLARLLPDGQFAFLGRADDQIKIRGYRIEPDEIATALNRHPDIEASVVAAREDGVGEKRLVAYVVANQALQATPAELRMFLGNFLPDYMLPTTFVLLQALPMTAHGKIDRAALPEPDAANTLGAAMPGSKDAPRTALEKRTAELIAGLLGLEEVSREDNFFLLGGHSLLGAQLVAKLQKEFGVSISLRGLFEAPTVASLSATVERLRESGERPEAHACSAAHSCTEGEI